MKRYLKKIPVVLACSMLCLGYSCVFSQSQTEDNRRIPPELLKKTKAPKQGSDIPALDPLDTFTHKQEKEVVSIFGPWTRYPLGEGWEYRTKVPLRQGQNHRILIAYSGYGATISHAKSWAAALAEAEEDNVLFDSVIAVSGPNQPQYLNREIANSKISQFIEEVNSSVDEVQLVLLAHSSGSFVVNELLEQLKDKQWLISTEIILFNLDGAKIKSKLISQIKSYVPVYAIGRSGESVWADVMKSEAAKYSNALAFGINAKESGCSASAQWCLHMAVVNEKPHNPSSSDVQRDYTDFESPRGVEHSYFGALDFH